MINIKWIQNKDKITISFLMKNNFNYNFNDNLLKYDLNDIFSLKNENLLQFRYNDLEIDLELFSKSSVDKTFVENNSSFVIILNSIDKELEWNYLLKDKNYLKNFISTDWDKFISYESDSSEDEEDPRIKYGNRIKEKLGYVPENFELSDIVNLNDYDL